MNLRSTAKGPVKGSFLEVFLAFLKLGLTSFGGPVAHLGYFRTEFVERRKWLDDKSYADLVALCQFLPGPASSQVGIALGLGRSGWRGALASWTGFTLPSAVALILFALGISQWPEVAQSGIIHGLKVAAVAIVAHAVWSMAKTLCPDWPRAGIAIASVIMVMAIPSTTGQIIALVSGGAFAMLMQQRGQGSPVQHHDYGLSRFAGGILLIIFAMLLVALPLASAWLQLPALTMFKDFYQAGALVFGGGHVVLPLLQASVVPSGWVSSDIFLAGYGATQAIPGPLFTFAAYLGAVMPSPFGGWMGGFALLLAIFLPAMLLVAGALPYWERLRQHAGLQQAMAGVNAAVVGVLAAALYSPMWTSSIHSISDLGAALLAFALLVYARLSPVLVVMLTAFLGWLLAL
ncbi:chromate efflux transporter [Comamonas sp. NoAH]|uniref:chromate efflux transporter n=1 Tax=Comamonas halotolerans TaxID=3041496 RepID=UPI0024E10800|nr:chromate efflux transporter [Comamonas sp. NoAH]